MKEQEEKDRSIVLDFLTGGLTALMGRFSQMESQPQIEWPPRKEGTRASRYPVGSVSKYPTELGARYEIVDGILGERLRQEQLREEGRFTHTCASPEMSHEDCYLVLGEEVGEVARAILEGNRSHAESLDKHGKDLRKELIQVAAVCMAWVERIDREAKPFQKGLHTCPYCMRGHVCMGKCAAPLHKCETVTCHYTFSE